MKLYLVQHGKALSKEVDPDRPLSDTGRNDIRRLTTFLPGNVDVSRVMHSGKPRARQTAALLATALAPQASVETASGLNPNDPPQALVLQLETQNDDLLVVSHMPFIGRLGSLLITGLWPIVNHAAIGV